MSDTSKTKPDTEKRITIAITETNHKNLKVAAMVRGKDIREAADEAVSKWVGNPEKLRAKLAETVVG